MRFTERRENGGKRKQGIFEKEFPREIRKRKKQPKEKGSHAESVKPSKHLQRSMPYLLAQIHLGRQIQHSSGLPAVGDGLSHSWHGRSRTAFRSGTDEQRKRESDEIP